MELFGGYASTSPEPMRFSGRFDDQRFAQDAADSTYRAARTLLNRGEWRQAAALFGSIPRRFPQSEYRPDALYWQAFALYRIGGTTELREGLTALETRQSQFPSARNQGDATSLATRIRGALAARGDAAAAAALRTTAAQGSAACDEEDLSVRASALNALMRADPATAQTQLERVLARRDECSVPLRKNAVMIIAGREDAAARSRLSTVATSDPSIDVRVDAIGYLAKFPDQQTVTQLAQITRSADEERAQRAAIRALGEMEIPTARQAVRAVVENRDASERLRLEALGTFDRGGSPDFAYEIDCDDNVCTTMPMTPVAMPGVPVPPRAVAPAAPVATPAPAAAPRSAPAPPRAATPRPPGVAAVEAPGMDLALWRNSERALSADDAAWLRGVYPRLETTRLKSRAASVLARATDEASVTWLMNLIQREEESPDVRSAVLARLGRNLSIAQLSRIYDAAANRSVRRQIVSTLGDRDEAAATDKLIEIVRTGTDPQLRRSAISALTRKNDPRTTQLLLEMIDR